MTSDSIINYSMICCPKIIPACKYNKHAVDLHSVLNKRKHAPAETNTLHAFIHDHDRCHNMT